LARYSAIESALASGFDTAELHHLWGRDRGRLLKLGFERLNIRLHLENRSSVGRIGSIDILLFQSQ
ncbi:hypothetical protein NKJ20_33470, partial [Mesorhizobium sp. M0185]